MAQLEKVLHRQRRLTPLIIKNIIDNTESYQRQGVMIFSSTVKHAQEVMESLPPEQARLILGSTELTERDQIVNDFKNRAFKYLTGKKDCLVLDYTGMGHSIFSPEIGDKKPASESVAVQVPCPECGFVNDFWGIVDEDGSVVEHFGRKCRGGHTNPDTYEVTPCGYRFRFKICTQCSAQNDVTARDCSHCGSVLIDPDEKLKQAKLSRDAHVLTPDSIEMLEHFDKNGTPYLQIKYYDYDANHLAEVHYLNNQTSLKKFNINFLRSHMRRPELNLNISSASEVVKMQSHLRMPAFIIAGKQGKFWKITEKIFSEEL